MSRIEKVTNFIEKHTKITIAFFIMLLLLGLSIIAYPLISQYIDSLKVTELLVNYNNSVSAIEKSSAEKELELCNEYNKKVAGVDYREPYILNDYTKRLAFTEIMATLEIPTINVNLPIYHFANDETIYQGVGHMEMSSLPVGGASTHSVLTAHSGEPNKVLFTNLSDMVIGDFFYIHVLDQTLTYEVEEIKVIEPTKFDDLQIVNGKDYVTLVTCTPIGVNSHRLLVRGVRVE